MQARREYRKLTVQEETVSYHVVFPLRPYRIDYSTGTVIDKPHPLPCGSGTGLALIPPMSYYSRRRKWKRTRQE